MPTSVLLTEKRASDFLFQASRQLHLVVVDEMMCLCLCLFTVRYISLNKLCSMKAFSVTKNNESSKEGIDI